MAEQELDLLQFTACVHAIAKTRKTSTNRVAVALIEAGIQAQEDEKRHFFALANWIAESDDPVERQRIKGAVDPGALER